MFSQGRLSRSCHRLPGVNLDTESPVFHILSSETQALVLAIQARGCLKGG